MADGISEDMRVASGVKKPDEIVDRSLVEPLYRETIATLADYVPEELNQIEKDLFISQRELLIQTLTMSLSSHLLLSGRAAESAQVYPLLKPSPLADFAGTIQKVLETAADTVAYLQKDLPTDDLHGRKIQGAETENDLNPKHLIRTANDDFLSHKGRSGILEKYSRALDLLGLSFINKAGDISQERLDMAAEKFVETPYWIPMSGNIFYAADNILAINDFALARRYLLLDAKVREAENEYQHGFSKYLTDFIHCHTLARVLMQMGRFDDALHTLQKVAESAELYESPQDITGRTLGSLIVSRVLARYALLLELTGRKPESFVWWQKVLNRSESLLVMCELCADRLGVNDTASVDKVLNLLRSRQLSAEKSIHLIYYWWILNEMKKSDTAELVNEVVHDRADWLASMVAFVGGDLLSQRNNCSAAEPLIKMIEDAISKAPEHEFASLQYALIGIYLQQALSCQQVDQSDEAEASYKKGLSLVDQIKRQSIEADPQNALKSDYVQAELVKEYGLFLASRNRLSELESLRSNDA
jgi:tetratricopeptide (TPR) repeat protein